MLSMVGHFCGHHVSMNDSNITLIKKKLLNVNASVSIIYTFPSLISVRDPRPSIALQNYKNMINKPEI